jgi:hypothetical protein
VRRGPLLELLLLDIGKLARFPHTPGYSALGGPI